MFLRGVQLFSPRRDDSCRTMARGLLLVMIAACGCSNNLPVLTNGGAHATTANEFEGRTLLMSEIQNLRQRGGRIECPIELVNTARTPRKVTLTGTGCHCYGVFEQDRKLDLGTTLEIPPGEVLRLQVVGQPPLTESLQEYRTTFQDESDAATEALDIQCRLQVYHDLKVTPAVLTCEADLHQSADIEQLLTIEQIFRSEDGQVLPPQLLNLPAGVQQRELTRLAEPELIEPGLWRAVWQAVLQVHVPSEIAVAGETETFVTTFTPLQEGLPQVSVTNRLVRRPRVPLVFPRRIQFGRLASDSTPRRTIFVGSRDETPFELQLDEAQLPAGLTGQVHSLTPSRYRVDLSLSHEFGKHRPSAEDDPKASPLLSATVSFLTNLATLPHFTITIEATLPDSSGSE